MYEVLREMLVNAVVVHDSQHCDKGSTPAPCRNIYLIKVTLFKCEKSAVEFDSTKHRRFSLGTSVPSCSSTRLMENSLGKQ